MFNIFCPLVGKETPSDFLNGLLWPVERGKSIAKPC